jgi:hypothetical protein
VSKALAEDITSLIETIPIQTLTISDEQFLTGDAAGRPTTISETLKVAQGSGHLPLVILLHGSGGIEENAVVWERVFGSLGISTFSVDSFTGRGIVSTVGDPRLISQSRDAASRSSWDLTGLNLGLQHN